MGPVFYIVDRNKKFTIYSTKPEDAHDYVEIRGVRDLAERYNLFDLQDIADGFDIAHTGNKYDLAGVIWQALERNAIDFTTPKTKPKRLRKMFTDAD